MASYGELIQSLKSLLSVKEKRHAIKTLASMCGNRAYQMRIIQAGGWGDAILPLLLSLDEECRNYAALAAANLTTSAVTHEPLVLERDCLRHLIPVLYEQDQHELAIFVLNALGNLAATSTVWDEMARLDLLPATVTLLKHQQAEKAKGGSSASEQLIVNSLFLLANLTACDSHRSVMVNELQLLKLVWRYVHDQNYRVMFQAIAIIRGLSVHPRAQEELPKMGIFPVLIAILKLQPGQVQLPPHDLRGHAVDILLHLSFSVEHNARRIVENEDLVEVIASLASVEQAASTDSIEFITPALCTIANLCEDPELHEILMEGQGFKLFTSLQDHVMSEHTAIQEHVMRGVMHLCMSPRYHHIIIASGVLSNVMAIALTERLVLPMRTAAIQIMASLSGTHPDAASDKDLVDMIFLCCNDQEDYQVRRFAAMALANCSSSKESLIVACRRPYLEALLNVVCSIGRGGEDSVLVANLCRFFHNSVKLEPASGIILLRCSFLRRLFLSGELLRTMSIEACVYLCDLLRYLAADDSARSDVMASDKGNPLVFSRIQECWSGYLKDSKLGPHLALLCCAYTYHLDTHNEFVLQGGVRLVCRLYQNFPVDEHVRLCSLLTLLYVSSDPAAQKAVSTNDGLRILIRAAEQESHIDLISSALKALLPFSKNEVYRAQLGSPGLRGLDTCGSFLFSDKLELKQVAVYLLQNLLENKANRRVFLGLHDEYNKVEENYLKPLVGTLPVIKTGPPKKIPLDKKAKKNPTEEQPFPHGDIFTNHDPFVVRCAVHCLALLALERDDTSHVRLIELNAPILLYNIFYSGQVDRATGEAILLFFAELCHAEPNTLGRLLKSLQGSGTATLVPLLLSFHTLGFSHHTRLRCLSALLTLSKQQEFAMRMTQEVKTIADVCRNVLSPPQGIAMDFHTSCATAAILCALLCEFAQLNSESAHRELEACRAVELFLLFITAATSITAQEAGVENQGTVQNGVRVVLFVELLLCAVAGISALICSRYCPQTFMKSLLFPATRVQLFASLLRIPSEDIDRQFFLGTIGLKTLQRNLLPSLLADDLNVETRMAAVDFTARMSVPPSALMHRHIARTLVAILVKHAEFSSYCQAALSSDNLVPACVFCLQGTEDTLTQFLGYALTGVTAQHDPVKPPLASTPAALNDIIGYARRFSQHFTTTDLDKYKSGFVVSTSKKWNSTTIGFHRFIMALIAMVELGEHIKIRYDPNTGRSKHPSRAQQGGKGATSMFGEGEGEDVDMEKLLQEKLQLDLTKSNIEYIHRLPGFFLKSIDVDLLLNHFYNVYLSCRQKGKADNEGNRPPPRKLDENAEEQKEEEDNDDLEQAPLDQKVAPRKDELGLLFDQVHEEVVKISVLAAHRSLAVSSEAKYKEMHKSFGREPPGSMRVPDELKAGFSHADLLQMKTDQLLNLCVRCLEYGVSSEVPAVCLEMITCLSFGFSSGTSSSAAPKCAMMLKIAPPEIQLRAAALFSNSLHPKTLDVNSLQKCVDVGYVFTLLSGRDALLRRYMVGALANLSTNLACLRHIVVPSGVLKFFVAFPPPMENESPTKFFDEHFDLILEMSRLLCNASSTAASPQALNPLEEAKLNKRVVKSRTNVLASTTPIWEDIYTNDIISFLYDVLLHSFTLITGLRAKHKDDGAPAEGEEDEGLQVSEVSLTFTEIDLPPLGLKIRYQSPPMVLSVMPGTPADRRADEAAAEDDSFKVSEGDELVKINEVDITEVPYEEIMEMLQPRPLKMTFRRRESIEKAKPPVLATGEREPGFKEPTAADCGVFIVDRYKECFRLSLTAVHNMIMTTPDTHPILLRHQRFLDLLINTFLNADLENPQLASVAITPDLRRILFALLTCLCRTPTISEHVSHSILGYVSRHAEDDRALQMYGLVASSLHFSGTPIQTLIPDTEKLDLIVKLVQQDDSGSTSMRTILIEIFHRVAQSPRADIRARLLNPTMFAVLVQFIEQCDVWRIQLRALETFYLLSMHSLNEETCHLWVTSRVFPCAVAVAKRQLQSQVPDSLTVWSLILRSSCKFAAHPELLGQLFASSELDSFLLTLFAEKATTVMPALSPQLLSELRTVAAELLLRLMFASVRDTFPWPGEGGICPYWLHQHAQNISKTPPVLISLWRRWEATGLVENLKRCLREYSTRALLIDLDTENDGELDAMSEAAKSSMSLAHWFNDILQIFDFALSTSLISASSIALDSDLIKTFRVRLEHLWLTIFRSSLGPAAQDEKEGLEPEKVDEAGVVSFRLLMRFLGLCLCSNPLASLGSGDEDGGAPSNVHGFMAAGKQLPPTHLLIPIGQVLLRFATGRRCSLGVKRPAILNLVAITDDRIVSRSIVDSDLWHVLLLQEAVPSKAYSPTQTLVLSIFARLCTLAADRVASRHLDVAISLLRTYGSITVPPEDASALGLPLVLRAVCALAISAGKALGDALVEPKCLPITRLLWKMAGWKLRPFTKSLEEEAENVKSGVTVPDEPPQVLQWVFAFSESGVKVASSDPQFLLAQSSYYTQTILNSCLSNSEFFRMASMTLVDFFPNDQFELGRHSVFNLDSKRSSMINVWISIVHAINCLQFRPEKDKTGEVADTLLPWLDEMGRHFDLKSPKDTFGDGRLAFALSVLTSSVLSWDVRSVWMQRVAKTEVFYALLEFLSLRVSLAVETPKEIAEASYGFSHFGQLDDLTVELILYSLVRFINLAAGCEPQGVESHDSPWMARSQSLLQSHKTATSWVAIRCVKSISAPSGFHIFSQVRPSTTLASSRLLSRGMQFLSSLGCFGGMVVHTGEEEIPKIFAPLLAHTWELLAPLTLSDPATKEPLSLQMANALTTSLTPVSGEDLDIGTVAACTDRVTLSASLLATLSKMIACEEPEKRRFLPTKVKIRMLSLLTRFGEDTSLTSMTLLPLLSSIRNQISAGDSWWPDDPMVTLLDHISVFLQQKVKLLLEMYPRRASVVEGSPPIESYHRRSLAELASLIRTMAVVSLLDANYVRVAGKNPEDQSKFVAKILVASLQTVERYVSAGLNATLSENDKRDKSAGKKTGANVGTIVLQEIIDDFLAVLQLGLLFLNEKNVPFPEEIDADRLEKLLRYSHNVKLGKTDEKDGDGQKKRDRTDEMEPGIIGDPSIIKTVYMLVTRGFRFPTRYFPDILGTVAFSLSYSPQEEQVREIAKILCSIIITAPKRKDSGGGSGGGNVAINTSGAPNRVCSLIRHMTSVHEEGDIARCAWHLRKISKWSRLPKISEQLIEDHELVVKKKYKSIVWDERTRKMHSCFDWLFLCLREPTLSRYAVNILHAISVFNPEFLCTAMIRHPVSFDMVPALEEVAQMYIRIQKEPSKVVLGDFTIPFEREVLRRLTMATFRNALSYSDDRFLETKGVPFLVLLSEIAPCLADLDHLHFLQGVHRLMKLSCNLSEKNAVAMARVLLERKDFTSLISRVVLFEAKELSIQLLSRARGRQSLPYSPGENARDVTELSRELHETSEKVLQITGEIPTLLKSEKSRKNVPKPPDLYQSKKAEERKQRAAELASAKQGPILNPQEYLEHTLVLLALNTYLKSWWNFFDFYQLPQDFENTDPEKTQRIFEKNRNLKAYSPAETEKFLLRLCGLAKPPDDPLSNLAAIEGSSKSSNDSNSKKDKYMQDHKKLDKFAPVEVPDVPPIKPGLHPLLCRLCADFLNYTLCGFSLGNEEILRQEELLLKQRVALLMPSYLGHEDKRVKKAGLNACYVADLHQSVSVCEYLVDHFQDNVNICCDVLSLALVDAEEDNLDSRKYSEEFVPSLEGTRLLPDIATLGRFAVTYGLHTIKEPPLFNRETREQLFKVMTCLLGAMSVSESFRSEMLTPEGAESIKQFMSIMGDMGTASARRMLYLFFGILATGDGDPIGKMKTELATHIIDLMPQLLSNSDKDAETYLHLSTYFLWRLCRHRMEETSASARQALFRKKLHSVILKASLCQEEALPSDRSSRICVAFLHELLSSNDCERVLLDLKIDLIPALIHHLKEAENWIDVHLISFLLLKYRRSDIFQREVLPHLIPALDLAASANPEEAMRDLQVKVPESPKKAKKKLAVPGGPLSPLSEVSEPPPPPIDGVTLLIDPGVNPTKASLTNLCLCTWALRRLVNKPHLPPLVNSLLQSLVNSKTMKIILKMFSWASSDPAGLGEGSEDAYAESVPALLSILMRHEVLHSTCFVNGGLDALCDMDFGPESTTPGAIKYIRRKVLFLECALSLIPKSAFRIAAACPRFIEKVIEITGDTLKVVTSGVAEESGVPLARYYGVLLPSLIKEYQNLYPMPLFETCRKPCFEQVLLPCLAGSLSGPLREQILDYVGSSFGEFDKLISSNFSSVCARLINGKQDFLSKSAAQCVCGLLEAPTDNEQQKLARLRLLSYFLRGGAILGCLLPRALQAGTSAQTSLWLCRLFGIMTSTANEDDECLEQLVQSQRLDAFLSLLMSEFEGRREVTMKWMRSFGVEGSAIDEILTASLSGDMSDPIREAEHYLTLLTLARNSKLPPSAAFKIRMVGMVLAGLEWAVDNQNRISGMGKGKQEVKGQSEGFEMDEEEDEEAKKEREKGKRRGLNGESKMISPDVLDQLAGICESEKDEYLHCSVLHALYNWVCIYEKQDILMSLWQSGYAIQWVAKMAGRIPKDGKDPNLAGRTFANLVLLQLCKLIPLAPTFIASNSSFFDSLLSFQGQALDPEISQELSFPTIQAYFSVIVGLAETVIIPACLNSRHSALSHARALSSSALAEFRSSLLLPSNRPNTDPKCPGLLEVLLTEFLRENGQKRFFEIEEVDEETGDLHIALELEPLIRKVVGFSLACLLDNREAKHLLLSPMRFYPDNTSPVYRLLCKKVMGEVSKSLAPKPLTSFKDADAKAQMESTLSPDSALLTMAIGDAPPQTLGDEMVKSAESDASLEMVHHVFYKLFLTPGTAVVRRRSLLVFSNMITAYPWLVADVFRIPEKASQFFSAVQRMCSDGNVISTRCIVRVILFLLKHLSTPLSVSDISAPAVVNQRQKSELPEGQEDLFHPETLAIMRANRNIAEKLLTPNLICMVLEHVERQARQRPDVYCDDVVLCFFLFFAKCSRNPIREGIAKNFEICSYGKSDPEQRARFILSKVATASGLAVEPHPPAWSAWWWIDEFLDPSLQPAKGSDKGSSQQNSRPMTQGSGSRGGGSSGDGARGPQGGGPSSNPCPEKVCRLLPRIIARAMRLPEEISTKLSCLATCVLCLLDVEVFVHRQNTSESQFLRLFCSLIENLRPQDISNLAVLPYPMVHTSMLLLASILSSISLPVCSRSISQKFVVEYWSLVGEILKYLCEFDADSQLLSQEGGVLMHPSRKSEVLPMTLPYQLFLRWLHFGHIIQPPKIGFKIRTLATYLAGQVINPPRITMPLQTIQNSEDNFPPTTYGQRIQKMQAMRCSSTLVPPAALLESFAMEMCTPLTLKEQKAVGSEGPVSGSIEAANGLYGIRCGTFRLTEELSRDSLEFIEAMTSPNIRGVALQQLMALRTPPTASLVRAGEKSARIALVVNAVTCFRLGLRLLMDLWCPPEVKGNSFSPSAPVSLGTQEMPQGLGGPQNHLSHVMKQPGGRDMLVYLIKHITSSYNSRTAHVSELGTPWEKLLTSQGLNGLIDQLFLTICSVDSNLFAVENLGGNRALLALSRYAIQRRIREQSTLLLTKLAIKLANKHSQEVNKKTKGKAK